MNLGLLDLGQDLDGCTATDRVQRTIELAQLAEAQGFGRFWLAEHHVPGARLAAPEVILPMLAAGTEAIKLGAGGVLLRYYSPVKVAEVYMTLAAAFPDRIELGICRGPGVASEQLALALVSGNDAELRPDSYDGKVDELFRLLETAAQGRPGEVPLPPDVTPPPVWMLGSGDLSLTQALRHCARYGVMLFHPGSDRYGGFAVDRYRSCLRQAVDEGPLIAVTTLCAPTDAQARRMDEALVARGVIASHVVGSPERCADRLCEIAAACGVDDVLVTCLSAQFDDHCRLVTALGESLTPA